MITLQSLAHIALRPQKRGCLLGIGTGGKGMREWRLDHGNCLKKTGETVDCCQNNGSVKAVSPRHCTATSAPHNCCFNCCAWAESQRQCLLHCCWGTTQSERSPTFAAQLHLPAHDLFWAEGPAPSPSSWSRLEPCSMWHYSHTKNSLDTWRSGLKNSGDEHYSHTKNTPAVVLKIVVTNPTATLRIY